MKDLRYLWIIGLAACSAIVDADSSRFNDDIECDLDCDDDVACTRDECINDACQNTPQDDLCDDGFICNPNARNGSGCVPADCDLDCTDPPGCPGDSCFDCDTPGYCNDTADACVYVLRDEDDDGHGVVQVGDQDCSELDPNADDCDDNDPSRNPSQPEVCDHVDNDCDDEVDFTNETNKRCLGEACDNPLPITLSSGEFTHTGMLSHYNDSLPALFQPMGTLCSNGTGNGRDVVYRLTVSQAMDLVIDAEATGSPAVDLVLGVRNSAGCSPDNPSFYSYENTCHDNINAADSDSRVYIQNFGEDSNARTLYVVLKSRISLPSDDDDPPQWPFQLTVTASDASAPMCSSDAVDISGGGLLVAQLGSNNDASAEPACIVSANDSTAQFSVASAGVPGSGQLYTVSSDFDPVMYLRKDSCAGEEIGCDGDGYIVLDFDFEGIDLGTTNYVVVDGGDVGDFYFLRYEPPEP